MSQENTLKSPSNTCELFLIIDDMTSTELKILDTLVYLSEKYDNNIYASRSKKALNSGCSESSVKRFERRYREVLFAKTFRDHKTNEIRFSEEIRTELLDLKTLINHLGNFKIHKKTLCHSVMFNNLTFSNLNTKLGGVMKNSKLFITQEKAQKNKKAVHNSKSHRGKRLLMNKNEKQNDPPPKSNFDPQHYISSFTLEKKALKPFSISDFKNTKKSLVYKTLEKYQLLKCKLKGQDLISLSKIKSWEKYPEEKLEKSLQRLFYVMSNPKPRSKPIESVEAYLETLLQCEKLRKTREVKRL